MARGKLNIGWASADITPEKPVLIAGQFHARVSEGILDRLTATALALEAPGSNRAAIMISVDLVSIQDVLRDAVRAEAASRIPGLEPTAVCLNGTHTHSGPNTSIADDPLRQGVTGSPSRYGLSPEELGVMKGSDYVSFAAGRIADAAERAWKERRPGGIGFGLGQAAVGRNRRVVYYGGEARMYGNTDDPEFSHIEGATDSDVNLLCTYDGEGKLTGLVVNVACPAQVSEHVFQLSADYWHETRQELRHRLGKELFVLAQCGAAGDQSPHVMLNRKAEARMLRLKGLSESAPETLDGNLGDPLALRREIAARIGDAVTATVPHVSREIDYEPEFDRRTETVGITRNMLTADDVRDAAAGRAEWEEKYRALRADLDAHPEKKREPRWYIDISRAWGRMRWFAGVEKRFSLQEQEPRLPVEITVLRLGGVAIATDPFEYYLDFGLQIRARSRAVQTFVVQLAGTGTYVPTERAVAGKSYGAVPASNPIGARGGREVVEETLRMIGELWPESG